VGRDGHPLRCAVVGCGKIGAGFADDPLLRGDVFTHVEAYTRAAGMQLVAICDSRTERRAACGRRWGVRGRYATVREMLRHEALDVVSVCTPSGTHDAVIRELLRAPNRPRAILSEKPLASSLAAGRRVAADAERAGVLLGVVYMRRFARNLRTVQRLIAQGTWGRLRYVHGVYTKGVKHNGSHWFDLLRMMGAEPRTVTATLARGRMSSDPQLDVEMSLIGGATGRLHCHDARDYSVFEMDLVLSRGRVRITDSGFRVSAYKAEPSRHYTGYVELRRVRSDFGHRRNLMLGAVCNLRDALRRGAPLRSAAADGLAALAIAEAAVTSARRRTPVDLAAPDV